MDGYLPSTYGDRFADVYDESYQDVSDGGPGAGPGGRLAVEAFVAPPGGDGDAAVSGRATPHRAG